MIFGWLKMSNKHYLSTHYSHYEVNNNKQEHTGLYLSTQINSLAVTLAGKQKQQLACLGSASSPVTVPGC